MKRILFALVLVSVAMVVIAVWSNDEIPGAAKSTPVTLQPAQTSGHMHEYAVTGRVPAYYTTAPDVATLPPTLSPELFNGNERLAYQVAKDIPQVLAELPCYCHCDRGHNHKSLHSCFESEHGENCGICINEALMARSLHKQGMTASEIRGRIIAAYGRH